MKRSALLAVMVCAVVLIADAAAQEEGDEPSPPPLPSVELQSTFFVSPDDVRICGVFQQESTKIITVRLSP